MILITSYSLIEVVSEYGTGCGDCRFGEDADYILWLIKTTISRGAVAAEG